MPAHSAVKARDSYDSLSYLAEFVGVARQLAFDATRLHPLSSPSSNLVSKPPHRVTLQPLHRFEICPLEVTQLDISYTLV